MSDKVDQADRVVRAQYEAYPYPPRDPKDEKTRLITGSPSQLAELNHYLFTGRRDFRRPFRALVAGGGTGDAAIMLAQQLADVGDAGEVVYLDVSAASRAVAEARAAVRGLENLQFHTASLLDLPGLGLGKFDYIDCCGVLHHLDDPQAGLAALTEVLDDGGGMGLMLYASLGRTGVYPVQRALRALLGEADDPATQVAMARRLLDGLADGNWLKRNPYLGDHLLGDDAALYDLLLHSRDRAYLVPGVAELAAAAGLAITAFVELVRYDPATYLHDDELKARAKDLDWLERAALAENLAGSLKTHVFYAAPAARAEGRVAKVTGPATVPLLIGQAASSLAQALAGKDRLKVDFDGVAVRFALPPATAEIVGLIDGRRSLGGIQAALGLDWLDFRIRFGALYRVLNGLNMLLLKEPG